MRKIVTTKLTKGQIADIREGLKLGKRFMLIAQPLILEGKLQVVHLSQKEFDRVSRYVKRLGYGYKANRT